YEDPEFSWKWAVAPAGIGFAGRGLGPQHAHDLFVGAARTFLDGGYLFEFKFDPTRQHFAFSDPKLADKVDDNDYKFDEGESDSLVAGENFGIVTDIVTGPGAGGGPHVKVFDGAALQSGVTRELRSFFAFDAHFTGGVNVAVGDVNGDGFADVLVGADAGGGPHVKAFSGADGHLLANFFAYDAGFRGGVRVAAGDVDGDGRAEVVTGAGRGGGPHVIVRDGRTLAVRESFFAFDPAFLGGVFVG